MAVKPIPDGFHTVTPYLISEGADKLIDFIQKAFDAKNIAKHDAPDGSIMHAQATIGDSIIMLSEARGEFKAMPAMLHLYVADADKTYKQAIQAGGKSLREPADQFYGDRSGGVLDPCGNQWWISTHVEDVSPEEMAKRQAELAKQQSH
jgi:uncharacterized glyoxalase superfamily protein PhnB